jgi:hypothetical protein
MDLRVINTHVLKQYNPENTPATCKTWWDWLFSLFFPYKNL